eukprot:CAMPEP_0182442428 /NCGR_PEP_ID=MMETSP1172-20130603/1349_1 /TAXON_ID=708627 /ORGANISM="Timspurckia oligopyrenoides, Strain CCMP3278" /LENGTH=569 /DNA_ID=CAMNT_0024637283 /DNA_START=25 /DNA_END=1734 /DNA_ORIENTATION=+
MSGSDGDVKEKGEKEVEEEGVEESEKVGESELHGSGDIKTNEEENVDGRAKVEIRNENNFGDDEVDEGLEDSDLENFVISRKKVVVKSDVKSESKEERRNSPAQKSESDNDDAILSDDKAKLSSPEARRNITNSARMRARVDRTPDSNGEIDEHDESEQENGAERLNESDSYRTDDRNHRQRGVETREIEILPVEQDLNQQSAKRAVFKLPSTLSIQPHVFDRDQFDEDEVSVVTDRSSLTNRTRLCDRAIRWRFKEEFLSKHGDNAEEITQKLYEVSSQSNLESILDSNARFVQWSDGSLTLHIGNEPAGAFEVIRDVFENTLESENSKKILPELLPNGARKNSKVQVVQKVFRRLPRAQLSQGLVHEKMMLRPMDLAARVAAVTNKFDEKVSSSPNKVTPGKRTIVLMPAPDIAPDVEEQQNAYREQVRARQHAKLAAERRKKELKLLEAEDAAGQRRGGASNYSRRRSERYLEDRNSDDEDLELSSQDELEDEDDEGFIDDEDEEVDDYYKKKKDATRSGGRKAKIAKSGRGRADSESSDADEDALDLSPQRTAKKRRVVSEEDDE